VSYEQHCTCGHTIRRHETWVATGFCCQDCGCEHFTREEALEPKLTKADKLVLVHIPECGEHEYRLRELDEARSIWQIAEWLNTIELLDLQRTLSGLEHLDYICSSQSRSRKRAVYWRTPKGDQAVSPQKPDHKQEEATTCPK
jgi:hypothetical protein